MINRLMGEDIVDIWTPSNADFPQISLKSQFRGASQFHFAIGKLRYLISIHGTLRPVVRESVLAGQTAQQSAVSVLSHFSQFDGI
jgi:hypothetical protein